MTLLPTLAVLLLLTLEYGSPHNLVRKSIYRANRECYHYLRGSPRDFAECGARCQQIVLGAWRNEPSGLDGIAYGRHFRPDCDDWLYRNRTERCIGCFGGGDSCRKSAITWECYLDQYGELVGSPQVVPIPDLVLRSTVEQCARILQVGEHDVADGNLQLTPAGRRLLRCVIIREGFYTDFGGPKLDDLYVQCGGYQEDEEVFKKKFRSCHEELLSERPDRHTLAARLVSECIPRSSMTQRNVVPGNPSVELPAGTTSASCMVTQLAVCATTCNKMAIAKQCSKPPLLGPIPISVILATFPRDNGFLLTGPLIQTLPTSVRNCIIEQFKFCRGNCLPDSMSSSCNPVL